jgi:heptaprenyl diphosphate synthase
VAPRPLFLAGAVLIVAFLLQGSLYVRVGQVLLFAFLAVLAGKRIRWGYFIIMVSSITLFNLLTPVGQVLFELGPWPITRGALEQGLLKGFAIVGLVFISLTAVRPDLELPGTFGGMLARLFYYFEQILDARKRVKASALVGSLDEILFDMYPPEHASPGTDRAGENESALPQPTDLIGWIGMVAVVAANVVLAVLF